jgi:transposase
VFRLVEGSPDGRASPARQFTPEFKRGAVNLARSAGRPLAQIARELGVDETSLGNWVARDPEQWAAANPGRFAAGGRRV